MADCTRAHRYLTIFAQLSDSQAKGGRHKCAGCAYGQGYDDAFAGNPPNYRPNVLDDSQAGEVRHKDPHSAYNLGYYHGLDHRAAQHPV